MLYFTSDLHLGHKGIINLSNRPFSSVEEMNNIIITNINSVVKKDDTLYILGDISNRINKEEAVKLIKQINCMNIHLLQGNHDFDYSNDNLFISIQDFLCIDANGFSFALMHYPMLSWPKSHSGSINLHGHIHSQSDYNLENKENGIRRYDVGVDANHFFPISIKEIIKFFDL